MLCESIHSSHALIREVVEAKYGDSQVLEMLLCTDSPDTGVYRRGIYA